MYTLQLAQYSCSLCKKFSYIVHVSYGMSHLGEREWVRRGGGGGGKRGVC